MTRRAASFAERKQIDAYLQEVALQFDLAGKALGYKDGHSDAMVAKHFGEDISPHTVARIRTMEYGCNLNHNTSTLKSRVKALEAEVVEIKERLKARSN